MGRDGSGIQVLVGRRAYDPHQVKHKARKEIETKYPNMVKY